MSSAESFGKQHDGPRAAGAAAAAAETAKAAAKAEAEGQEDSSGRPPLRASWVLQILPLRQG